MPVRIVDLQHPGHVIANSLVLGLAIDVALVVSALVRPDWAERIVG